MNILLAGPSILPGEFEVHEDNSMPEPEEEATAPTIGSMGTGENVPTDGVDVPVPDDGFFGDTIYFQDHFCQNWEIDITPLCDFDQEQFATPDGYVLAAVNERKKRTEVRLKELSQDDQKLFAIAKHKELKAWLQHRTIRKVAQGKIPEHAIMRRRWLFVWKSPNGNEDPSELSKDGKKAKARLIVIGYEDPNIDEVVNDVPTLSKGDGRMVVLQDVGSHQWPLISFDISNAFLHGKEDGRPLGIIPTPEMLRCAMH